MSNNDFVFDSSVQFGDPSPKSNATDGRPPPPQLGWGDPTVMFPGDTAVDSLMSTPDGLNQYGDAFAEEGWYNGRDETLRLSRRVAEVNVASSFRPLVTRVHSSFSGFAPSDSSTGFTGFASAPDTGPGRA